jgi:hypothetical protein
MYFRFEQEPLAESEVEARRHHPESFGPLFPPGSPLILWRPYWTELVASLRQGPTAFFADDNLLAENRMEAFRNSSSFVASQLIILTSSWSKAPSAAWSGFTLLGYAPQ